ncbi:right-handed parallel beta-helix repeat-containing protein [Demequina sp. TTPB684]|uniref:right-handed parallel beta-helix repeat-containing protein n=1 Tax=unclassified Demequina TaxID=2620311 RepID=UPI001CF1E635|nr:MULTISPECIES: right-handed parallel beta-helix repeat-containing protein [unclassified Demequina]MCB2413294.1 right-handed parallel beta-helix repeat-containing protein [Demequina sp. TTPB684]UPU88986.1 right-handed parallel beta-helix repeat-containing protein [Demequina sp. TMPB413]
MTKTMTIIAVLALAGLAWLGLGSRVDAQAQGAEEPADSGTETVASYDGDPEAEASWVQREDERLELVADVQRDVRTEPATHSYPYRVDTEPFTTLVLPPRPAPYTVPDLLNVAPDTVTKDVTGVVTIGEHVVVARGATLELTSDDAMRIRLLSNEEGFASIVTIGGTLVLEGSESTQLAVASWDGDGPDETTADGRAYIRASGAEARVRNVDVSSLGFWSGKTGGLSFVGNESPRDALPPLVEAGSTDSHAEAERDTTTASPSGNFGATDEPLRALALAPAVEVYRTQVTDNAFGMFVSGTGPAQIAESTVLDSRVDGIVIHRDADGTMLSHTEASSSGRDGIRVMAGSHAVALLGTTTNDNGRNGVTVYADALAEGPSVSGSSTSPFSDHRIESSVAENNADFGIRIHGGDSIAVSHNRVDGGRYGIAVSGPAEEVSVVGNQVESVQSQGISFWDGVAGAARANSVDGAQIGIYARAADAELLANTITDATVHGVSVVGTATGTTIAGNEVAGAGSSAVDTLRAEGAVVSETNDVANWSYGSFFERAVDFATTPLSLMWALLGLILALAASVRIRARRAGVRHPYEDREPLEKLTPGAIEPQEVRRDETASGRHTDVRDEHAESQWFAPVFADDDANVRSTR